MYTTVAFSLTGGNILKWFRDQFGTEEVRKASETDRNAYELLLEQVEDKPSDLTVLPYFTPSGTPYFDTETAGAVLGLRLSTTRGEFIRALLEGVAFEMRLNLDILERTGCEVRELRAIGGGAKSETWTQLKADVIGKPITVLDVTEAGCLGAAMLAAAADTGEPVAELAARWSRPVGVKQPRNEFVQHYSTKFDEYRRVYPAVRGMG
jgi:xylulokinase